jgi:hypothetical protein
MNDDVLYVRLKAACCSLWAIPPWEFDRAAAAHEIAVEDVLESGMLGAMQPLSGDLLAYLFREKEAEQQGRLARMKALVLQFEGTSDPEKRAKLQQVMNELNAR